jgi:hypothetical protein
LINWFKKSDPVSAIKNWFKKEQPTEAEAKAVAQKTKQSLGDQLKGLFSSLKRFKIVKLPMLIFKRVKAMSKGEREKWLTQFKRVQASKDWKTAWRMITQLIGAPAPGKTASTQKQADVIIFLGTEWEHIQLMEENDPRLWYKIIAVLVNITVTALYFIGIELLIGWVLKSIFD